jgi:signal transduction histidine kinase
MRRTFYKPLARYGTGVASVAVAALVTLLLWPLVKPLATPLFLAAIVFTALRCGKGPGLLTTVLSGLTIDFIFVPPLYQLSGGWDDVGRLLVFVAEGFTLSWFIDSHKRIGDAVRASREQLRALSARLQSASEEERAHIAREIHDELGQELTGLKYDIFFLRDLAEKLDDEQGRRAMSEKINSSLKSIDGIIHSVRRIATELRPAVLDTLGLAAAVEWQTADFQQRTGIKCRLDSNAEEVSLDPAKATALFRVFQEGLTNVARHSGATEVKIGLVSDGGRLLLRLEDNGRGIGEGQISGSDSLGILGMRERVLLLDGELRISGAEGRGTTVTVLMPLEDGARKGAAEGARRWQTS